MASRKNGRQAPKGNQTSNRQASDKLEKIGALWLGESQKGTKYMSGVVQDAEGNDIRVIVFKNGYKEEDKHPDYVVYLQQERQSASNGRGNASRTTREEEPPGDSEEVPF